MTGFLLVPVILKVLADRFELNFENFVSDITKPDDFIRKVYIDYELTFDDISEDLIDEIESLNPFGTGNREPLFMARDIMVVSSKIVGKNHRRMLLKQSGGNTGRQENRANGYRRNLTRTFPLQ